MPSRTAALLVAALLPGLAAAQTAPASGRPLRLEEALELAARYDVTPGIAAARLRRVEAQRRETFSPLLPSLVVSGTYTRRAYEVVREVGGQDVIVSADDAFGAIAVLDARIFDASALAGLDASKLAVEAQRLDSGELRRALSFDVAESFIAVLTAEALRDATDRRFAYAQSVTGEARQRLAAGLGERAAVTRAELELAAARLTRTQARTAVFTSRNLLGLYLGADAARPLLAPTEGPPVPRDAEPVRADVEAAEKRIRIAEIAAREPWLRLIPTLGLRGTARLTNEPGLSGQTGDWNVGLTLSWALFDGGLRYAQAAAREAQVEEAKLLTTGLRRSIRLQLENAGVALDQAQVAVDEARERQRLAIENGREVRERVKAGLASPLEQADASVNEFEAAADEARQVFAARRAALALLEALGRWPVDDGGTPAGREPTP